MKIKITQFNQRRRQRGATPLEVAIIYSETERDILWMTQTDLKKNIEQFGAHPDLLRGLECYRQNRLVEKVEGYKEGLSNASRTENQYRQQGGKG